MFRSLAEFYKSHEWEEFRRVLIAERTKDDGFVYDEVTGKPIVRPYDLILHHVEELTPENVNDFSISLNPSNIQIVSHKTHNQIHNKLGYICRQVFLVYGSPLSGKSSYVKEVMNEGDLIIDMDRIWSCVSGMDEYIKPPRLNAVVFKIRDTLIEGVKYRLGKWCNAYIVGGYPLQAERERLTKELGAREIYIDSTPEKCKGRLGSDGRDVAAWEKFIDDWWERYTPPSSC
jgi:hypothetical protein